MGRRLVSGCLVRVLVLKMLLKVWLYVRMCWWLLSMVIFVGDDLMIFLLNCLSLSILCSCLWDCLSSCVFLMVSMD